MKCPSCGHEQAEGLIECQKCQIVFTKWEAMHGQSAGVGPQGPAGTPIVQPLPASVVQPKDKSPAGVGLLIGALLVIIAALWWVFFPGGGKPVSTFAYKHEKHQFALVPPSGWIMLTPENYQEIFAQYGDRFPETFRQGMTQGSIQIGFVKIEAEKKFAPTVNVVVIDKGLPPINEEAKKEVSQAISSAFAGLLADYKLETTEIVELDRLKSIQLTSTASMDVMVGTETFTGDVEYGERGKRWYVTKSYGYRGQPGVREIWERFGLKFTQTLVPGSKRGYIITCMSTSDNFPQDEKIFGEVLDSFRVLKRPPPFGPVVMGGIKGGLTGAGVFLLMALLKVLFS